MIVGKDDRLRIVKHGILEDTLWVDDDRVAATARDLKFTKEAVFSIDVECDELLWRIGSVVPSEMVRHLIDGLEISMTWGGFVWGGPGGEFEGGADRGSFCWADAFDLGEFEGSEFLQAGYAIRLRFEQFFRDLDGGSSLGSDPKENGNEFARAEFVGAMAQESLPWLVFAGTLVQGDVDPLF